MKLRAIIILAIIAALGLGIWLASRYFLTTGQLTVKASDPEGEIVLLADGAEPQSLGQGQGSKRLSPGSYTVEARSASGSTRAVTSVQSRQTTRLDLEIKPAVSATRVASYTARDLFISSTSLSFLNLPASQIFRLPLGGQTAQAFLPDLFRIKRLWWIDSNRVLAHTTADQLVLLSGTTQKNLDITGFATNDDEPLGLGEVSVNSRGQMVLSVGRKLFFYADPNAKPRPLFTSQFDGPVPVLAESGQILVYHSAALVNEVAPNYLLDPGAGKAREILKGARLELAAWSPDSQHLAYVSDNGLFSLKLESDTTPLQLLRPSHNRILGWLDPSSLFFADGNSLWQHRLGTGTTSKLTDLPTQPHLLTDFSLSPDNKTIYIATGPATPVIGGVGNIFAVVPNLVLQIHQP